jgi:hypothetical protein
LLPSNNTEACSIVCLPNIVTLNYQHHFLHSQTVLMLVGSTTGTGLMKRSRGLLGSSKMQESVVGRPIDESACLFKGGRLAVPTMATNRYNCTICAVY